MVITDLAVTKIYVGQRVKTVVPWTMSSLHVLLIHLEFLRTSMVVFFFIFFRMDTILYVFCFYKL